MPPFEKLLKTVFLIILLVLLSWLTCFHIDKSILLVKYLLLYNIQYLIGNYSTYHHSLGDFLYKTSIFHPGNSEAGWRTVIFLWPLFVFCDALGGLTLTNICLFTVMTSLLTLVLFYWWVKKYWGQPSAFWGSILFGYSAIFQELARSGSYDAYSVLLAMLWIILFYHCATKATVLAYGLLGCFTGFSWYGYGMIRTFIGPALIEIFCFARQKIFAACFFLAGMSLWILPGIIILLQQLHRYHFHGPSLSIMLIDKENIVTVAHGNISLFQKILSNNLWSFLKRMSGFNDTLDFSWNQAHAHYLHHLLVLPMLIGIKRVFDLRSTLRARLLLLLGGIIYLTPLFTSDWGSHEARRFLFYVLPTYCFIGIGTQQLLSWVQYKPAVRFLILVGVCFVLIAEADFTCRLILYGQRDLGLNEFAEQLNNRKGHADIVYLEKKKDSLYIYCEEGYLLKLLLEKNGQHFYKIRESLLDTPFDKAKGHFYLAKSPLISDMEFKKWCEKNGLKCSLPLIVSPVKDQPADNPQGRFFELFSPSPLKGKP